MKTILLKGGFVVTPEAVIRSDIILREGRLQLVDGKTQSDKEVNIKGKYVVPGFVDIHFHGYNLFEFTAGLYDPESDSFDNSRTAYRQGFEMLSRKLAEFGVTGFYVASGTDSIDTLKTCYSRLAEFFNGPEDTLLGARLLGALLEGPFINPSMAGAMNPELVQEPLREVFDSIDDGGTIKMANVVPDAGLKSCELIQYLTEKGIIVGAGHTNATCRQIEQAVKAGLKYCIHFTNGPTGGSYKPFEGGGAVEAVLKFDELYAEQICDGFHVNPAYVLDIIKRKGIDKILGITDCAYVVGSDVKDFSIGGVHGAVSDDGTHLRVVGKVNTLFGSTLTMNRGFANLLNWLTTDMQGIWNRLHEALRFEEALMAAVRIFSTNPCELTGRAKQGCGSIVDGARADLTVLDIAGLAGDYKVSVESTIVDGNMVYQA